MTTKLLEAINPALLFTALRFPSEKVRLDVASKGLSVAQLFVGVSKTESLPSPADTEKLFTVKSFPFGLLSIPSAAVLELSLKSK